jgi:copper chaperone CopZ
MNILKFKTNVRCDNCKAKIKPFLDEKTNIKKWDVDLTVPERILTVEGEEVKPDEVKDALSKAGYTAETIKN